MKHYITYLLVFFLVISQLACKKKQQEGNVSNTVAYTDTIKNTTSQILEIVGNQIWVRDTPSTGKVIMKLDNGIKCKVLEKGVKQTINGLTDYWYKIQCNGKTGWVFGAQTSLRQQQQQTVAVASINDAIETIKNNNFLQLIGDSIYIIENQGAGISIKSYSIDEVKSKLPQIKNNAKIFYDKTPVFDGETYEEKGIFVNDVKDSIIPDWIEVPEDLKNIQNKVQKVIEYIDNDDTAYNFYLLKSGNTYKIILIDIMQAGEA